MIFVTTPYRASTLTDCCSGQMVEGGESEPSALPPLFGYPQSLRPLSTWEDKSVIISQKCVSWPAEGFNVTTFNNKIFIQ